MKNLTNPAGRWPPALAPKKRAEQEDLGNKNINAYSKSNCYPLENNQFVELVFLNPQSILDDVDYQKTTGSYQRSAFTQQRIKEIVEVTSEQKRG